MRQSVIRGLLRRDAKNLTYEFICLDEKAVFKGHNYITVMSDPITKSVIDIIEHRTIVATTELLNTLSETQQKRVKAVAMDMWDAYNTTVKDVLPQAEIVHDKFHVVKKLNNAVDETRRKEKDPALKHMRFLLFKNRHDLDDKQFLKFENIINLNLKTSQAWLFKEVFKYLFSVANYDTFYTLFIQWLAEVKNSGIKPMIKVANTIENNINGILNIFKHKLTNSAAEGLNAKIKEINIIGKGYRSVESIRYAILFFNGKLDLFPHI